MLGLDGLDADKRHTPGGEKIPRGDLQHIDAAQLADVAPTGNDRAHLCGAALHFVLRQSGEQRAGQRCAETGDHSQNTGGRRGALGGNQGEQPTGQGNAADQPRKLLLVFIAGAVGGTVGQKAAQHLHGAADQHTGVRLGQAGGDGAQGTGIAQTVGHGVLHLGADKGEVVPHGDKMQPLADGVQQKHQGGRPGQQCAVGVGLGDKQNQALHQGTQRRQNGQAVGRGGPGKADQTGKHGTPVDGAGGSQQNQRHAGIYRRLCQHAGQRGQGGGQNAQGQQHGSGGQRDDAGNALVEQVVVQLTLHGGGVLGALVLVAVGYGQLGCVKGLGGGVALFVRRRAA